MNVDIQPGIIQINIRKTGTWVIRASLFCSMRAALGIPRLSSERVEYGELHSNLPHSCPMDHRVISGHSPTFRYDMPASCNPVFLGLFLFCALHSLVIRSTSNQDFAPFRPVFFFFFFFPILSFPDDPGGQSPNAASREQDPVTDRNLSQML